MAQEPQVPSDEDHLVVAQLLGRQPQAGFSIGLRRNDGSPVVLVNAPLLNDGRPMPTRYWLVDRRLVKAIGHLESVGGVKAAEAQIPQQAIAATHEAYARARDCLIDPDHDGPRPHGGVGGTRQGVKCLHAHYAYHLMGGADPVGRWVEDQLALQGQAFDPAEPAG